MPASTTPRSAGFELSERLSNTWESMRYISRISARLGNLLLPAISVAAALALWEILCRTGVVDQHYLPSMSTSFTALWHQMTTGSFWHALLLTIRGWALGLGIAAILAIPLGIALGSSDFFSHAFRVPIEFLRPIPSAALIPLLVLTLGTNIKSE